MFELSVIPSSCSNTQTTDDSVPQRRHPAEDVVLDDRDLLGSVDGRVPQVLPRLLPSTQLGSWTDNGGQRGQDDVADVHRYYSRLVRYSKITTEKLMIAADELIGECIGGSNDRGGWVERDEGGFAVSDSVRT